MELEEMKMQWEKMSETIEKQQKLTDALIIKMTQADYNKKISKVYVPEAISAVICLAQIVYVAANFEKLNTWYLMVCGIASSVILASLALLSLSAIRRMQSVNVTENTYKQVLMTYSKGKIRFMFVQKLSFYLGFILMLMALPVATALINNSVDLFKTSKLWYAYGACFLIFFVFARWVYNYYARTVVQAEHLLKELEE